MCRLQVLVNERLVSANHSIRRIDGVLSSLRGSSFSVTLTLIKHTTVLKR